MTTNKKAPAGAGTPTRAAGDGLPTMYPTKNFTTSTGKVLHISDLLHSGAENGIKLPELVKLTGQEERIVRRRIQAERKAGKLICRLLAWLFSASIRAGSAAFLFDP